MTFLLQAGQWVLDHWKDIVGVCIVIEHGVFGAYMAVWHAGGVRTIWANMLGPEQPTATNKKQ